LDPSRWCQGAVDNGRYIYPLVMTNSLPWYRWPIEIDGLPNLKMGGFSKANC
jgi:hypothetical protein